jgi:XTP/dITP diphosphohydrolase
VSAPPRSAYREVVLASGNAGKLLEVRAILGDLPISLRAAAAFPEILLPEEGDDYEANAVAKARAAARGAGRLALGDDSGLEVDALGGRPGPHSARYGGAALDDGARNARLLEELDGVEDERRGARFVCVAALVTPEGDAVVARGECAGRILRAPRGSGGFGYDPVFAPRLDDGPAHRRGASMAELPPGEKNRLSHRGRAFRGLVEALRARL